MAVDCIDRIISNNYKYVTKLKDSVNKLHIDCAGLWFEIRISAFALLNFLHAHAAAIKAIS